MTCKNWEHFEFVELRQEESNSPWSLTEEMLLFHLMAFNSICYETGKILMMIFFLVWWFTFRLARCNRYWQFPVKFFIQRVCNYKMLLRNWWSAPSLFSFKFIYTRIVPLDEVSFGTLESSLAFCWRLNVHRLFTYWKFGLTDPVWGPARIYLSAGRSRWRDRVQFFSCRLRNANWNDFTRFLNCCQIKMQNNNNNYRFLKAICNY